MSDRGNMRPSVMLEALLAVKGVARPQADDVVLTSLQYASEVVLAFEADQKSVPLGMIAAAEMKLCSARFLSDRRHVSKEQGLRDELLCMACELVLAGFHLIHHETTAEEVVSNLKSGRALRSKLRAGINRYRRQQAFAHVTWSIAVVASTLKLCGRPAKPRAASSLIRKFDNASAAYERCCAIAVVQHLSRSGSTPVSGLDGLSSGKGGGVVAPPPAHRTLENRRGLSVSSSTSKGGSNVRSVCSCIKHWSRNGCIVRAERRRLGHILGYFPAGCAVIGAATKPDESYSYSFRVRGDDVAERSAAGPSDHPLRFIPGGMRGIRSHDNAGIQIIEIKAISMLRKSSLNGASADTGGIASAAAQKRIVLDASPQLSERLDELADNLQMSKTAAVRYAVSVLADLADEISGGNKLFVRTKDDEMRQIMIPTLGLCKSRPDASTGESPRRFNGRR